MEKVWASTKSKSTTWMMMSSNASCILTRGLILHDICGSTGTTSGFCEMAEVSYDSKQLAVIKVIIWTVL